MLLFQKSSPIIQLSIVYVFIGILLRIVLMFHPITQSSFSFLEIIPIFILGIISDFFVFVIMSSFLWLYLLFLSNSKFDKPWGYLIFASLVLLLLYFAFFNTILNEYGGSLPEIVISFIGLKTLLFGLLLFLPMYRSKIRLALFTFTIFLFVLLIIQNAVSEFFFWNEFGVKYNFIAVDYLVYTNAVIGNILESYPVIPLFAGIGILSIIFTYLIVKNTKINLEKLPAFKQKAIYLGVYIPLFIMALFAIPFLSKQENTTNVFANEL